MTGGMNRPIKGSPRRSNDAKHRVRSTSPGRQIATAAFGGLEMTLATLAMTGELLEPGLAQKDDFHELRERHVAEEREQKERPVEFGERREPQRGGKR